VILVLSVDVGCSVAAAILRDYRERLVERMNVVVCNRGKPCQSEKLADGATGDKNPTTGC
jgi:hypothetical protein